MFSAHKNTKKNTNEINLWSSCKHKRKQIGKKKRKKRLLSIKHAYLDAKLHRNIVELHLDVNLREKFETNKQKFMSTKKEKEIKTQEEKRKRERKQKRTKTHETCSSPPASAILDWKGGCQRARREKQENKKKKFHKSCHMTTWRINNKTNTQPNSIHFLLCCLRCSPHGCWSHILQHFSICRHYLPYVFPATDNLF